MSVGVRAAVCWVLLACATLSSSGQTSRPVAVADFQDVMFAGGGAPLYLRLHFRGDEQAISAAWTAYVRRLFDYLDVDGDKRLSRGEAARAPSPGQIVLALRTGVLSLQPAGPTPRLIDRDEDGFISFDEFVAHYAAAAGPMIWQPVPTDLAAVQSVNATLLRLLDADRDGKLSEAELGAADSLMSLDADDDEVLTVAELLSQGPQPAAAMQPQQTPSMQMAKAPAAKPVSATAFVAIVRRGAGAKAHAHELSARQLFEALDRDHTGVVRLANSGFDKETFDRIDANHDGRLDVGELVDHLDTPPEIELLVTLGKSPAISVVKDPHGLATVDAGRPGCVRFGSARGVCELFAATPRLPAGAAEFRQAYLEQFKMADAEGKGAIDADALSEGRRPGTLLQIFGFADRNGDGQLTAAELEAFLDLAAAGQSACVSLVPDSPPPGLFQLLDANHDGRLTRRELRATRASAVAALGGKMAGFVAPADIPTRHTLVIAAGPPGHATPGSDAAPAGTPPPLWFRKMDRNADGEVTPREFLGPLDAFKRLDANHDGVLTPDEAGRK